MTTYEAGSAADFEAEWARCAPWIEAALGEGIQTHSLDDVKADVVARQARFWAGQNAAAVTRIEAFPRLSIFTIWLAGGDLEELRETMLPQFEANARENGCRFAGIVGRKGWSRTLGYKPIHYACAKELIDE